MDLGAEFHFTVFFIYYMRYVHVLISVQLSHLFSNCTLVSAEI